MPKGGAPLYRRNMHSKERKKINSCLAFLESSNMKSMDSQLLYSFRYSLRFVDTFGL